MKRKLAVFIIVITLLMQFIPTLNAVAAGMSSDGYILVSTPAELNAIRNNLTGRYRLTNNITLSGYWTPVGTSGTGKMFAGILDGAGYEIIGLNVSVSSYAGLFGYTSGVTIKNLHIVGGSVSASNVSSYAGSFVGYSKGSLLLEGCTSSATINSRNYTGGLVGYGSFNGSVITKSEYYGKLVGAADTGGIIGKITPDSSSAARSTISMCRVIIDNDNINQATKNATERVTGTSSVGGIAGEIAATTITQCYTSVMVKGNTSTGGIAGKILVTNSHTTTIADCYSTGHVSGGTDTGGIVGAGFGSSSIKHTITRCYSTSDVYATSGRTVCKCQ